MTKQEMIEEITRRLVDFYLPVRIYLFGSEARGESGPDSDLDFCVVRTTRRKASTGTGAFISVFGVCRLRWMPFRLPCSDFDARAAHVVASLPTTVVREGRLLYDASRVAA